MKYVNLLYVWRLYSYVDEAVWMAKEKKWDQLKSYNRKVEGRSRKKRRIRGILVHVRSYLWLKRWAGQIVSPSQTSFL